ncbi:bifunctional nicotinamidase/pyrazinamidase [Sinomicrobium weinanense]|uniref:Nicotinamidase n=1 Tax=Sinomicrobium weinanense TaxID=2842200 RepID=A0A926Q027_9FLAO|nr:bifunctional nicotinamidase/pyrazinamidase [Sinomicrobium weinanense]MBC9794587.1 bifunctional nicotinamidase/pyrazinamidase [Sinomicrobium weinanense]MBU3124072.1 bifunctional nicotinamidase/pyrazinamidase [Sinomicrobium weinanense]
MKALLIVDVQNDFLPGGNLAVPQGDEVIPEINALQPRFDLVVATQDWHPQGHQSFASAHPGKDPFEVVDLHGLEQVLWPDHCVQGSQGADFASALEKNRIAAIFRKGMHPEVDSYSGFFDNGKKYVTGLASYLREMKVTEVYVCGLAADYCVYYTAKDARNSGFETYYLTDATRCISRDTYEKAISDLQQIGVHLITTDEL